MSASPPSSSDSKSPPRKAAVAFIFVTVCLDILALGIIIPVLPNLVKAFTGGDTASAASTYALFGTVFAAMQFLLSPLLGALSDRFGRRPVVLLSNLGLGLDYILMALAPTLRWLFLGRVISGICSASISTAYAYIADVTPREKRAAAFGKMGAAFGLGFVVGPGLGGLLGSINPRLPFWAAGALSLANAAYGFFILPESLPRDRRARFSWKSANPVGSLEFLASHRNLAGLAAVSFLLGLAHVVFPSTFVLYGGERYGWREGSVGLVMAVIGVSSGVFQGLVVGRAVKWLGERRALIAGIIIGAIAFAMFGLAPNGLFFCLTIPIMSLWGLAGPSNQSLMTRRLRPDEQGRLQGSLQSLTGVASMIGPEMFNQVFSAAIGRYRHLGVPGAPFLLASACVVIALPFALKYGSVPAGEPIANPTLPPATPGDPAEAPLSEIVAAPAISAKA